MKYTGGLREFEGIKYRDDCQILSKLELMLVDFILTPLNRLFAGTPRK